MLSKRHRDAAENGSQHAFARRLAVLFAGALPSTPNLLRAYGSRASEIIRSPLAVSQSSANAALFQDWIGADGTTIWAAATSGSEAIAVHLLACMLARIWTASEATAIWDEIIQARKHELSQNDPAAPLNISSVAASRVDITREQMAAWDASARSWLSMADGVKRREQKQLMLLTKDIGVPINQKMNVYSSVMDAWKTAMQTMENIISGMPYNIQDGSVLLGLASWYLYPDLYVVRQTSKHVAMKDDLISPGGVVTLGLWSSSPDSARGVYWSLPLAHLRYYGDPVKLTREVSEMSTRLTMEDCLHVTLGSVFAGWGRYGDPMTPACRLMLSLWDFIANSGIVRLTLRRPWLQSLAQAAETYLTVAEGIEKDLIENLIARGRRRYSNFLAKLSKHPGPMFGMANLHILLSLVDGLDNKSAALQWLTTRLRFLGDPLLIRSRTNRIERDQLSPELLQPDVTAGTQPSSIDVDRAPPANTSAHNSRKRKYEDEMKGSNGPNWVHLQNEHDWNSQYALEERTWIIQYIQIHREMPPFRNKLGDNVRWDYILEPNFEYKRIELGGIDHTGLAVTNVIPSASALTKSMPIPGTPVYECIIGDPDEVAIFRSMTTLVSTLTQVDMETLETFLQQKWIDPARLVTHLENLEYIIDKDDNSVQSDEHEPFDKSDQLGEDDESDQLDEADESDQLDEDESFDEFVGSNWSDEYDEYPIHPEYTPITERAVNDGNYASIELITYSLSRAQTFACIAMFEDRSVNLDPDSLQQLFALSAGNSIYVAMPLVCDPSEDPLPYEMKRVVGNIGQPGISLMISPIQPKVRKVDNDTWRQVNHARFDGRFEDCFSHTSMHLSFTNYKLPVAVASHGDQMVAANFVETLVSVFDRDEWIADLDILGALSKPCLVRFSPHLHDNRRHSLQRYPNFRLSSINSLDEYLDWPLDAAIFHAHQNLYARLAAATLSAQLNFNTIVLTDVDNVCAGCAYSGLARAEAFA
ncbi:MAG: hypothetical protein Q9157_001215 [Trypethelium eluteriae]